MWGNYQMVSNPDFRITLRFEYKSLVTLADEHSEYFSYAQMFNFSGGGLYFELESLFEIV
jgi:hypothetical protein